MKTLGHILLILIAAAVVIGATYALSQTTPFSALVGQPIGGVELAGRSGPPDFATGPGAPADETGFRQGGEERGGSWATVGRNLLQITAIVAAVQVLWSIGRWIKRKIVSPTRPTQLKVNQA